MSFLEAIQIDATLHAVDDKRFQCENCLAEYSHYPDADKRVDLSRRVKGCTEAMPAGKHRIGKDLAFTRCIGNYWSDAVLSFLEMHGAFETGILPFQGGLMDQPNKIIEVFRLIRQYKTNKIIEDSKKAGKK